ncbi:PREDICTED: UPF0481 [Prunus dulcis]|uniref:PREDICTED: UPF0481 n=1 Tax=Prunus dulcis TaxID=3755 RepID=A0A5E4GA42_PRUDU|nr:PREDICTED: UPF0481 [Prunus dulcis]
MTESNAKDHSVMENRHDHKEKADNVGKQTLNGNKNNDKLLASSIQGKLRKESPLPDQTCIYRVPHKLFRHNEEAFVPSLVSIGPYHHGEKKLQAMEEMKLWYLHGLIERKPNQNTSLEKFVTEIRSMEQFCRDCYDEKFDHMSSDIFVEMMVVDGCFIIELFRKNSRFLDDCPILNTAWMLSTITNDLLLLENQIPWKVAACLFDLTGEENENLHYVALLFFGNVFGNFSHPKEHISSERHFLDIARGAALGQPSREDNCFGHSIPSVTELLEIGVDFKCRIEMMKSDLLDITLENGVMRIPSLSIGDNGECFLRNLIAYEQCAANYADCYATSYAKLFSCLIKSTKDAEFLMEKGIMKTQLSKEDIACFFTRVCKDIEIEGDSLYFGDLAGSVEMYCERRWLRSWLTMIKRDYLYNPSSIWSVSSGVVVILILTITQTIYTVLSYYK